MALDPRHDTAVRKYAEELGVDPDVAAAIAEQESGSLGESALSPKGARGVMQVMPGTSAEMAPKYGPDRRRQGVGYYKERLESFGDIPDENERKNFALGAYNAGPGNVAKARAKAQRRGLDANVWTNVARFLPKETRDYVPGVLGRVKGRSGQTEVTPGEGVESVAQDDDSDLLAEAKETLDDSDLMAEAAGLEQPAEEEPRSVGEMAKEYVPGLRGLTDLAKLAGHVSGIRPLEESEWAEMAARGEEQRAHPIRTGLSVAGDIIGTAVPAARPFTALGAASGIGVEKATGSKTAGRIASAAVPIAASVGPGLARLGGKAVGLTRGESARELVTKGLGAEETAIEAGRKLQAPGAGSARGAITQTADEASRLYGEAQSAARAANAVVPASERAVLKAAREASKAGISGEAAKAVRTIRRLGHAKAPKAPYSPVGALPAAGKAARTDVAVADLIEAQSQLRRAINKMPYQAPGRAQLVDLSKTIDDVMAKASAGTEVGEKLGKARGYFREVTVPTRRTMGRVAAAEEPETAARVLTQTKRPTRFQRLEGQQLGPKGKEFAGTVESTRSAAFNDMIQGATSGGKTDLRKLHSALTKAEASGQLEHLANTVARKNTIRAIEKAAKVQSLAGKAPVAVGGTGAVGGWFGIGAGFTIGRIIQASLTNERASRALLRLAQARQGSPGWKAARDAFLKYAGPGALATERAATKENE